MHEMQNMRKGPQRLLLRGTTYLRRNAKKCKEDLAKAMGLRTIHEEQEAGAQVSNYITEGSKEEYDKLVLGVELPLIFCENSYFNNYMT